MPHRHRPAGLTDVNTPAPAANGGKGNPSGTHSRVLSGEQLSSGAGSPAAPRVGYVAVPADGRAGANGTARTVNFAPPHISSPPMSASPHMTAVPSAEAAGLPPLQEGYEYQPVHFVSREMDLPRVVEDPRAYRPGTPILNWEGPRRSNKPPKLQFWLTVTIICVITNVVSGTVPLTMDETSGQTFLAVWISVSALFMATFSYMATTRHLQAVTIQMEGINNPKDIDVVLERLENGRFSRLEEIWKVQVHMIKMFCRLLRHHHGVPTMVNSGNVGASAYQQQYGGGGRRSTGYDEDPLDCHTPNGSVVYNDDYGNEDDFDGIVMGGEGHQSETDPSLMSAMSTELDEVNDMSVSAPMGRRHGSAHFNASHSSLPGGTGGVRRARRGSAGLGVVASPTTPGLGFGSSTSRRPRLTNADPLCDNEKTWDEVLSAGGDGEGPSRSLFVQLLKQVKVGQDLSKIVLPVHILEPRSLLEKLSDLFVHPDLVGEIAAATDEVDRVRRLCRWFISAYHMRPKGVKKPYNPILGETFECVFAKGTADELWYFAEQVSHHPPITCFRALHIDSKIEVVGSYVPRSKLVTPNTGASIGEGFFDVYIPGSAQTYRLGWPNANAGGILSPPLRLELVGLVKVTPRDDQNDAVRAEIHFEPKPYFGGDYDCVRAGIFHGQSKYPTVVVKGKWHSTTYVMERTEQVALKKDGLNDTEPVPFFEPDNSDPVRPAALPTAFPKPSRLVWKNVTIALRSGDAKAAQEAKQTIESTEREIRRAREARGEEYVPGFFRIVGEVKGTGKDTWRYIGPTTTAQHSPPGTTLAPGGTPRGGAPRVQMPPSALAASGSLGGVEGTPPPRSPAALR